LGWWTGSSSINLSTRTQRDPGHEPCRFSWSYLGKELNFARRSGIASVAAPEGSATSSEGVNSKSSRNLFQVRVETARNDRNKSGRNRNRPSGLGFISRNLDSIPNVKTCGDRLGNHSDTERISTESGIATKPEKRTGKFNNSRRCDGDANVKLDSESHS
jgi:hypothetical protein